MMMRRLLVRVLRLVKLLLVLVQWRACQTQRLATCPSPPRRRRTAGSKAVVVAAARRGSAVTIIAAFVTLQTTPTTSFAVLIFVRRVARGVVASVVAGACPYTRASPRARAFSTSPRFG